MIPILYSANETAFTSNGLGRLTDAVSCVVTEERNGIYELELRYPITGPLFSTLAELGCFIGATHDDKRDVQPFKVYRFTAPIEGIVTFYAHHISYALSNVIVQPFTAGSLAEAFLKIASESVTPNPFTFWTDKVVTAPMTVPVPSSVRQILMGQEGSVLDVYGKGEYEFDVFNVKLRVNRGTNSGVRIRYGLNLADITKDIDTSGVYSAVAPFWRSEGQAVWLPEVVISHEQNAVAVPLDMTEHFEEAPTADQLRAAAEAFLENNEPWAPDENIEIDFVQLWQTEEYKNVAALQRVSLCDKVSVFYEALGVQIDNQEVIKVVYNTLLDRYDSMELGKLKTTLTETISAATRTDLGLQDAASISMLQAAIANASAFITGGRGGYVIMSQDGEGHPQEILIMDTDDPTTATSVIRLNKNGIGFSSNGINGPYSTAWTIDGSFSADYITAGTLDAGLIKAGVLASLDGGETFYLDLEQGELRMNVSSLQLSGQGVDVVMGGMIAPVSDDVAALKRHIEIGDDGSLTFRGGANDPYTLRIVNNALVIYNGDDAIGVFDENGVNTPNLNLGSGSFTHGGYKWIVYDTDGRMDLVYVGD